VIDRWAQFKRFSQTETTVTMKCVTLKSSPDTFVQQIDNEHTDSKELDCTVLCPTDISMLAKLAIHYCNPCAQTNVN
jgi:hypothetical protein